MGCWELACGHPTLMAPKVLSHYLPGICCHINPHWFTATSPQMLPPNAWPEVPSLVPPYPIWTQGAKLESQPSHSDWE